MHNNLYGPHIAESPGLSDHIIVFFPGYFWKKQEADQMPSFVF
jgi:hypothetical protein